MQVLGWSRTEFTPKGETKAVKGFNLFLCEERKGVEGMAVERAYISENKAADCGFVPEVNQEVELLYNRWGKVQSVNVIQ